MQTTLIRPARPEDATRLSALAERTFRDTFAADNTPEDMDQHCATSYSADLQSRELADPSIETVVAVTGSDLVGYVQIRDGAAPAIVDGPSPIEVWRLYVDRLFHGTGVAQALMTAALHAAARRGAATVWLGVWEHNARAQAFYRKMGFVDVGSHTFVVGSDVQTDRVMVRAVSRRN